MLGEDQPAQGGGAEVVDANGELEGDAGHDEQGLVLPPDGDGHALGIHVPRRPGVRRDQERRREYR